MMTGGRGRRPRRISNLLNLRKAINRPAPIEAAPGVLVLINVDTFVEEAACKSLSIKEIGDRQNWKYAIDKVISYR